MQNNKTLREKEQILRISGVNPLRCMRCGKCSATCPSYEEMEYHPHQFVYMVETGDIEPLLNSESLYKCLSCFACVERCPRGVEPAKLVEAIRLIKIRQKDANRMTADDVPPAAEADAGFAAAGSCQRVPQVHKIERNTKHAKNRCFCMPLRHKYCGNR